ncbi:MAG: hypothetical protein DI535_17920 [Citrobacter freundii]|nr:MAG: hypothetical protein DI535_17920 [Citrobacter freundii]
MRTTLNSKGRTRYLSWFFLMFIAVFIVVIYYFSSIKIELGFLHEINPFWLSIAFLSQWLTYIISALIYRRLLRCFNRENLPSLADTVKAAVIALLFNQTMPSAGISGNAFFYRFFTRYQFTRHQIVSVILIELVIFYVAVEMLMVLLLIITLFMPGSFNWIRSALVTGVGIYFILTAVVIHACGNKTFGRLYKHLSRVKIVRRLMENGLRVAGSSDNTSEAVRIGSFFRIHKTASLHALLLQLCLFITDAATLYVLFLGLGHPINPLIPLLALVSSQIISIVPFLPGGLILYEGSMSFFFTQSGSPAGLAIVVTMVYRLLSFWFPIPVGMYLYRRWLRSAYKNKNGVSPVG